MATLTPVHNCTLKTEPALFTPAASPACINTFVSILAAGDIYCPETTPRCLARHGHSEDCVKDLTSDEVADYVRRTQAAFIKSLLAQQWDAPMVEDLINALPVTNREALQFMVDIPGKKRAGMNPIALMFGVGKLGSPSDLALFKACLKTKDPELVAAAFNAYPKNTSINDLFEASFLAMIMISIESLEETEKDIAVATKIYDCLSALVQEMQLQTNPFVHIKGSFDEGSRIARQFHQAEGPKQAFSTSKKEVVEADPALYTHLRALYESTDHITTWNAIPKELLQEYTQSFVCVLSRVAVPYMKSGQIGETSLQACAKDLYGHINAIEDETTRKILNASLIIAEPEDKQDASE